MIFNVNNFEYEIWIPVYILNDANYNSNFYRFLLLLEFILSIFAGIFIIVTVFIISKTRAFHNNLTSLIIFILLSWILGTAGRILQIPYIIGTRTVGNVTSDIQFWWTDDELEMPKIDSIREAWPLFLGGFLTWHYMFVLITCFYILGLERTFASWFILDYERTSRWRIFRALLIFQHGIIFVMHWFCFFNHINFFLGFIVCFLFIILAVVIFISNWCYNKNLLKKFEQHTKESIELYTLAARFQAKENVRAFELTIRIIIVGFSLLIIGICCVIAINYKWIPSYSTLFVFCFQNLVHLNPLIVCPVLILSVSPWSKAIPFFRKVDCIALKSQRPVSLSGQNVAQETDFYFNQLQNTWELKN